MGRLGVQEELPHKIAPSVKEGPQDTPFTVSVRNQLVWGSTTSWRSSVLTLLCRTEITVVTANTELKSSSAVRIIGFQGGRGQVWVLNDKIQDGHGYCNGQGSQSSNHHSLTHRDLWHWLVDHDVSRKEVDV